jgi:hypothetical protein
MSAYNVLYGIYNRIDYNASNVKVDQKLING